MIQITLLGLMAVRGPEGENLTPRSRKAKALLAVLATSNNGVRARKWLQDLLWSDRADAQGAGSLRSCLTEIRKALGDFRDILKTDGFTIELDLKQAQVDVLEMDQAALAAAYAARVEFLEGFDVHDAEFEAWLRDERSRWQTAMGNAAGAQNATPQDTIPAQPVQVVMPDPMEPPFQQDWKLAIAVLPLENRTGDPTMQFVGEGLSEDIIDNLQRVRWLPVIARASSFSGKDQATDKRAYFAKSLGALYYVDGTVAQGRTGYTARLNLMETESEHLLWSETLELGELVDAALQDTLDEIVAAIVRAVANSHHRRVLVSPPADMDYLDHIWRGRWHMGQFTASDSQRAYSHFEAALQIQPNAAEALIQMGYWHLWGAWVRRDKNPDAFQMAANLARKAAAIDPDDGRCFAMLGTTLFWRHDHEEAETLFRHSLELTPSLALTHQQLGALLLYTDRPDEAVGPMKTAIRYSPRDHLEFGFQAELAAALFRIGHFEEAWERATIGIIRKPRYWYAHLVRILAAQQMGDSERIATAEAGLRESNLHLTPDHLEWLPLRDSEFRAELVSALETLKLN